MPSLPEFEAAFEAAYKGEPQHDYILGADASNIANVIAEMWHFKKYDRSIEDLTPSQKIAFERWKVVA